MTIGDYIKQVQAVNPQELAMGAMDENGEAITDHINASWEKGVTPDGDMLNRATWDGSEVTEDYRRKWRITSRLYTYRYINISGDTRRGLNVRGGRIFSATDYWELILRNFGEAGFSPVSFARVPTSNPAKRMTAASFVRLLRAKIAQP